MKIISGFEFLNTQHCVTGSMLHLFNFHHCEVSEEMLFGLGEGIDLFTGIPRETCPSWVGAIIPRAAAKNNVWKYWRHSAAAYLPLVRSLPAKQKPKRK